MLNDYYNKAKPKFRIHDAIETAHKHYIYPNSIHMKIAKDK